MIWEDLMVAIRSAPEIPLAMYTALGLGVKIPSDESLGLFDFRNKDGIKNFEKILDIDVVDSDILLQSYGAIIIYAEKHPTIDTLNKISLAVCGREYVQKHKERTAEDSDIYMVCYESNVIYYGVSRSGGPKLESKRLSDLLTTTEHCVQIGSILSEIEGTLDEHH